MEGNYRRNHQYPFQQKENYSKYSNAMAIMNRSNYQNSESILENSAVLNINLKMFEKIIKSVAQEGEDFNGVNFKLLEICATLQSLSPLTFRDKSQSLIVADEIQVEPELIGQDVIFFVEKNKDGLLEIKWVGKAEPEQVELHTLLVLGCRREYAYFDQNTNEQNPFMSLKKEKGQEPPAVPSLNEEEKYLLVEWMKNNDEFEMDQVYREFPSWNKKSINKFFDYVLFEGELANLGDRYLWM